MLVWLVFFLLPYKQQQQHREKNIKDIFGWSDMLMIVSKLVRWPLLLLLLFSGGNSRHIELFDDDVVVVLVGINRIII